MSDSDLARAISALVSALRPLDGSYMVIGGLAVILRGFPRHTDDIDVAVLGSSTTPRDLAVALSNGGFEPRIEDAVAFAEQSQVLLFRHRESGIEVDLSLAWLPFEHEAIAAADSIEIEGVQVPVGRAEDLLIYKAVAWRQRDRRDIRELLAIHRGEINLDRVRSIVKRFAEAIDEPERVAELEGLLDETTASI